MKVDSATATLLGTILGAAISQLANLINGYFGERKARRKLMYKTAFDYWKTAFDAAQASNNKNVPFEALFLYATELMAISERKYRSKEVFLAKVAEARARHDALIKNWMETSGPKIA
ncbi:MAG: hypothetical protein WB586_09890 [Chthoniobacterales bacterium]|jgi:hypothetical protein